MGRLVIFLGGVDAEMFPVRCYTCNTVVADRYQRYDEMIVERVHALVALETLGVHRMCCRRMFLGFVDITREQLPFGNVDSMLDGGRISLRRHVDAERRVSCD